MPAPRYIRSPRTLTATVGADVIVLDRATGEVMEFDGPSAIVWRLLAQPVEFAELRDTLVARYFAPPDDCERDLRSLLGELLTAGLALESNDAIRARASSAKSQIRSAPAQLESLAPSPEFELCVLSCRWAIGIADASRIELLLQRIDWTRLICLARFHRIQGQVWTCLSEFDDAAPVSAAEALRGDATDTAIANLRATIECSALLDAFTTAKVPLLFLKGQSLGALAYPNPSLKSGIDIDLLIDPADLERAAETLREMDYQVTVPSGTGGMKELRAWHRMSKESVWTKPSSTPIDLHTAVSDTPLLIPAINVHSPTQSVDVGAGITLPTLATDELFAHLAVHGAWSNWYRLKWLTDVAGLLRDRDRDEIDRIYSRSQELGAGRASGQTLMLADALFDTLCDNQKLRARFHFDRVQRRLVRHGLRSMTRDAGEPTERRFGTVQIHLAHLMLLPGAAAKFHELSRKARWLAFRLRH